MRSLRGMTNVFLLNMVQINKALNVLSKVSNFLGDGENSEFFSYKNDTWFWSPTHCQLCGFCFLISVPNISFFLKEFTEYYAKRIFIFT